MLTGKKMIKQAKLKEELRKTLEGKTNSEKVKYLNNNLIAKENSHGKRFWYNSNFDGDYIAWQNNVFQGSEIII